MKKFKIGKPRLIFLLLIILLFIIFLLYNYFIFSRIISKNEFLNQILVVSDENEEPIFTVQKIINYAGAGVISDTPDKPLENISIHQFTDLSIKIDNLSTITDLTPENTVKSLYIDNIKTDSNIETHLFNYKNYLNFGKFEMIENYTDNKINFNIINTNSENENADYSKPTFFTDCSNPITLGFLNKNILTNYSASKDSSTVTYNGKILKEANISLDDLYTTISFRINLTNKKDEKFIYNLKLDLPLDDSQNGIYSGSQLNSKNTSGDEYRFFKQAF